MRAEFCDRISTETIDRVAWEEVSLFQEARVRDFVPTIAWRLARSRLAQSLNQPNGMGSLDTSLPVGPVRGRRADRFDAPMSHLAPSDPR